MARYLLRNGMILGRRYVPNGILCHYHSYALRSLFQGIGIPEPSSMRFRQGNIWFSEANVPNSIHQLNLASNIPRGLAHTSGPEVSSASDC